MEIGKSIAIHSETVNEGSTRMSSKRCLPVESSFDGRVTKRRRSFDLPDTSGLPTTASGKEQTNGQSPGVRAGSATEHDGDCSDQQSNEDCETSSSSTDAEDTSEDTRSDDKEEGSSMQTGKTSPASKSNSPGDDEPIQNLPLPKKPHISALSPASDLRTQLSSFLPVLQKANADLQNSPEALARRLDEVAADEDHYIEMNLGLGVLKVKRPGTAGGDGVRLTEDSTSSGGQSDSDSEEGEEVMDPQEVERMPLTELKGGNQPSKKQSSIQELPST